MKTSELKAHLMSLDQQSLVAEVTELFQKFPVVKDYYETKLGSDGPAVLEKYKAIVTNQFFPKRGFGKAKLSVARKAVNDFKKLSKSPADTADIMLHYVEQGSRFTNEYGDIGESFYISMESMYEDALRFIVKHGLIEDWRDRCEAIIKNATEGRGFRDGLEASYEIEVLERGGPDGWG
ncbi:DUF6155 family protein [Methylomagnum sp.]